MPTVIAVIVPFKMNSETVLVPFGGSGDFFEINLGSGGTLEHQKATQRPQESAQEKNRNILFAPSPGQPLPSTIDIIISINNLTKQNSNILREFVLTHVILTTGACGREGPSSGC